MTWKHLSIDGAKGDADRQLTRHNNDSASPNDSKMEGTNRSCLPGKGQHDLASFGSDLPSVWMGLFSASG